MAIIIIKSMPFDPISYDFCLPRPRMLCSARTLSSIVSGSLFTYLLLCIRCVYKIESYNYSNSQFIFDSIPLNV